MSEKILCKIFYTPVQNPDKVRCIEVKDNKDLKIINEFFKKIVTKKLKKPSISKPIFSEKIITELMKKGLNINLNEVKNLFERLSTYMYGKAKEQKKYWCLIVTREYFFIYHFTPDKALSFRNNNIIEFIKYLDETSLLKFIFKLKSKSVSIYFEELSEEEIKEIQAKTTDIYGIYDKRGTKGIKKLTGEEPEYEYRGDLKVRIKRSDKTDIVVETSMDDLKNINSNIIFNFDKGLATINIENAPITELIIDGVKYDVKTGLKKIKYEELGIGEFIEKYRFKKDNKKIKEFKDYVIIEDIEEVTKKRICKPDKDYPKKEETIFILKDIVDDDKKLINDSVNAIKNNFNVAFVELNGFNSSYNEIKIGDFAIFAKLSNKNINTMENFLETWMKIIKEVRGNLTLEKTLYYVGLLVICEFLKSVGFKNKLYQIGKKALSEYYLNMSEKNIELKEFDSLGIEFKCGIKDVVIKEKIKKVGFFNPSPQQFSENLLKNFKRKRKNTIIFFIGINEDTRDFSPIPLNKVRNEFHESLKKHLSNNGINVLLSETIPISDKKGILIIILQK